jgi:hypothetical protein
MAVHATLGASSADKWYNCAASAAMEEAYAEPEQPRDSTDEGSAAHWVGEQCLRGRHKNVRPEQFLGYMVKVENGSKEEGTYYEREIECDEEMVRNVEIYVNYVLSLGGMLFIEERVDYSRWVPQGFGTADAIVEVEETMPDREGNVRPVNTLHVNDFKYGKGIVVSAFENKQGMHYALGALESLDFMFSKPIERIVVTIIQPRRDNISEYEIWVDDLLNWADEEVAHRAARAWELLQKYKKNTKAEDGDEFSTLSYLTEADFCPGKKTCQWCKARPRCRASAEMGYRIALDGFEDETIENLAEVEVVKPKKATKTKPEVKGNLRSYAGLSNEELAKIYLEHWPIFKAWGEKLKDYILPRAIAGEEFPGLKPVDGQARRQWKDEATAIKALRSAGLLKADYELTSVISPNQAEEVLKEKKPKDHKKRYATLEEAAVVLVPGNPTLAKSSDKRESIAEVQNLEDIEDDLNFLN